MSWVTLGSSRWGEKLAMFGSCEISRAPTSSPEGIRARQDPTCIFCSNYQTRLETPTSPKACGNRRCDSRAPWLVQGTRDDGLHELIQSQGFGTTAQ